MKENYKKINEQLEKFAKQGILGEEALFSSKEYEGMPDDFSRMIKFVQDLSSDIFSNKSEFDQAVFNMWTVLVALYHDCKKINKEVARSFAYSFVEDYPNMPNTALCLRFNTVANSCFAFKSVAHSGDPLLTWQQTSRLFLDYNEFMNGLLGYLIIAWRCALNKTINPNVLTSNYAVKANEFEALTNGENGFFYLFHRLIKPKLRNGIAHGTAWLDRDSNKIRYADGKAEKESEMDLMEFVVLTGFGSHLPKAYIAASATILIWEDGSEEQKALLPKHFIELLSHKTA